MNQCVVHYRGCVHALKSEIMHGIYTALLAASFMANRFHSNNRLRLQEKNHTLDHSAMRWVPLSTACSLSQFVPLCIHLMHKVFKRQPDSSYGNSPDWQRVRGGNKLSCMTCLHVPHSPLSNQAPLPTSNLVWRAPSPHPSSHSHPSAHSKWPVNVFLINSLAWFPVEIWYLYEESYNNSVHP